MPTSIRLCWIIHQVWKMYSASGTWTQSKHLVIQIAACLLACVFFIPLIHWSLNSPPPPPPFPCHLQPYGTEPGQRDKHFPWQRQLQFPFTCVPCVTAWFLSPFRAEWFSVAQAVMSPLYTICAAINRRFALRQQNFCRQFDVKALKPQLTNYLLPFIAFIL